MSVYQVVFDPAERISNSKESHPETKKLAKIQKHHGRPFIVTHQAPSVRPVPKTVPVPNVKGSTLQIPKRNLPYTVPEDDYLPLKLNSTWMGEDRVNKLLQNLHLDDLTETLPQSTSLKPIAPLKLPPRRTFLTELAMESGSNTTDITDDHIKEFQKWIKSLPKRSECDEDVKLDRVPLPNSIRGSVRALRQFLKNPAMIWKHFDCWSVPNNPVIWSVAHEADRRPPVLPSVTPPRSGSAELREMETDKVLRLMRSIDTRVSALDKRMNAWLQEVSVDASLMPTVVKE
jgi:hypothetical protein